MNILIITIKCSNKLHNYSDKGKFVLTWQCLLKGD